MPRGSRQRGRTADRNRPAQVLHGPSVLRGQRGYLAPHARPALVTLIDVRPAAPVAAGDIRISPDHGRIGIDRDPEAERLPTVVENLSRLAPVVGPASVAIEYEGTAGQIVLPVRADDRCIPA